MQCYSVLRLATSDASRTGVVADLRAERVIGAVSTSAVRTFRGRPAPRVDSAQRMVELILS